MSTEKLHLDPFLPVAERVAALMGEMTLPEKCGQLQYEYLDLEEGGSQDGDRWIQQGFGNFFINAKLPAGETAQRLNQMQQANRSQTRLGIPLLIHCESLHGLLSKETTIFPQALTLAASFDRSLVEAAFGAVAKEVRSRGMHISYAPVLDLGTEPRWGRVQETFGEDPYLVSELGVACVKGYQARLSQLEAGCIDSDHIICTAKHFAGYGQAAGGRNFGPYNGSRQFLVEHVLLPFRKAVEEAGLLGIMPGHHEIEGVPCHANAWLLDTVLRKEWGFDGILVSDADDIERLETLHHVSPDQVTSTRLALEAGLDIEILHSNCFLKLEEFVRKGQLAESLIDAAVERVLAVKFMLGLFEQPFADEAVAAAVAKSEAHLDLAEQAGAESAVLLKNDTTSAGLHALPVGIEQAGTIAVIGPTAAELYYGTYAPNGSPGTSILEGIQAYNRARGNPAEILWAQGCRITHFEPEDYETEADMARARKNPTPVSDADNAADLQAAVDLARKSDLVILCVGGNRFTEREAVYSAGHRGDRGSLRLAGSQERLIHQVAATGTPVVLLVAAGGPLELTPFVDEIAALLWVGYGGTRTGEAVASLLFGVTNPSGKLPITLPRSVAHLPCYYYQKATGNFKDYLFEESKPLFPFGFGLSYTTFEYSNLQLSQGAILPTEEVEVSVTVSNTGKRAGKETVQLYIRDNASSLTRPAKELKDFAKIDLGPGERRDVTFTLPPEALSFTNPQMEQVVEPGTFTITIGTNSISGLSAELEVKAPEEGIV